MNPIQGKPVKLVFSASTGAVPGTCTIVDENEQPYTLNPGSRLVILSGNISVIPVSADGSVTFYSQATPDAPTAYDHILIVNTGGNTTNQSFVTCGPGLFLPPGKNLGVKGSLSGNTVVDAIFEAVVIEKLNQIQCNQNPVVS